MLGITGTGEGGESQPECRVVRSLDMEPDTREAARQKRDGLKVD